MAHARTHSPPALPDGTAFVDAFIIDINGIPRGKRLATAAWAGASGVAFSASALVLDARGMSQGPLGLGTLDGNPDAIALPVPGMVQPVPWAGESVAQCLLSMRGDDDAALWYDPREVLRRVVARCRADGLFPVLSCELEFYLIGADAAGRSAPLTESQAGLVRPAAGHLGLQAIEDHGVFLHRLHAALAAQGIASDGMVAEYGPGQFELTVPHSPDPVLVADRAVLQRRATLGVAASMGLRASFMAKPFAQKAGSGLHVHVSLVDEAGRNRFGAPGGEALLHAAVAGLQALHAPCMAVFAPSFSAYRRYRPGEFVALSSAWGLDNRSVAFRIPRGPDAARRIEHRVAAADASPHLVVAAILAGLHHGITRNLRPTPPSRGSADAEPDPSLPRDLVSALRVFEADTVLNRYLPDRFAAMVCALKRAELDDLFAAVQPVEHDFYL
jgi:glutamine synthetase